MILFDFRKIGDFISQDSPERKNQKEILYMHKWEREILRSWLTCLCGLRSPQSAVCRLEAQENPRCHWVESKGLRAGSWCLKSQAQRLRRQEIPPFQRAWRKQQGARPSFLHLLFYQALSGLDDALPRWGVQSPLLSPQIQMLILSSNTLTDTPRNNVSFGHPVASQVET